jgi:hypothetical protein
MNDHRDQADPRIADFGRGGQTDTRPRSGRRPTHILLMKNRDSEDKNVNPVASLWENSDGSFTMRLALGVVLDWHDQRDFLLTVLKIASPASNVGRAHLEEDGPFAGSLKE